MLHPAIFPTITLNRLRLTEHGVLPSLQMYPPKNAKMYLFVLDFLYLIRVIFFLL